MKKALLFLAAALFVVATSNAVFAKKPAEAAPAAEVQVKEEVKPEGGEEMKEVKEEGKDDAEVKVKEEGKPEGGEEMKEVKEEGKDDAEVKVKEEGKPEGGEEVKEEGKK
jgi:hypothetical protein